MNEQEEKATNEKKNDAGRTQITSQKEKKEKNCASDGGGHYPAGALRYSLWNF